jgi:hypothetical protein
LTRTISITQPHIQTNSRFAAHRRDILQSMAALAAFDVFKAHGQSRQARKVVISVAIRTKQDTLSNF